jgi:hypothetical protein
MEKLFLSLLTLVTLISKRFSYFLFIVYFIVFLIGNSRFFYAGEREPVADLSTTVHSSGMLDPRFFEHEHLLGFQQRETLESKGLSIDLVYRADA